MLKDDDAIEIFIEESAEHLEYIENDLLAIEKDGDAIDLELVNKVFRAVHTVKGGAGFLGYQTINTLAHKMENIMGLVRDRKLSPTSKVISALLKAADTLKGMLDNLESSNETDISGPLQTLALADQPPAAQEASKKTSPSLPPVKKDILASDNKTAPPPLRQTDIARDEESVQIFVEESEEHLADIETDLLTIEKDGSAIDDTLVNKVFRAVHTIKGGAGFLNYANIKNLAHKMENVMGMIRERKLQPSPAIVSELLNGADFLRNMIRDLDGSNLVDINTPITALSDIASGQEKQIRPPAKPLSSIQEGAETAQPPGTQVSQGKRKDSVTPPSPSSPPGKETKSSDGSLRVNIRLLDQLMNLAGEMVLSRNQLVQAVDSKNMPGIESVKQRIDLITSELQEAIMFTRMQPIGNVFNRFPRLARELSMGLGKEVELLIEGEDVELDKTILEAISAPLTHLIRNSIDHGIEMPEERQLANKEKKGQITLRASHEAGLVILEVNDDGQGISPEKIAALAIKKGILSEEQVNSISEQEKLQLIFLPGFSTAEKVTDVSGRGVGMDVVRTNLEKLGGQIDITSKLGKGTNIRIKLPLTLAIISAQIVICSKQRYSIPQANLEELLRVAAHEIKDKIELIGSAPVLKLRGQLIPLVRLIDVLGGPSIYVDKNSGEEKTEKRTNLADRRSLKTYFSNPSATEELSAPDQATYERDPGDRRGKNSTLYIAIVNTGNIKYGLVVDALKDAEEIVVKPLGNHLKTCQMYSGATIMGDGRVSLILDVANIAKKAGLVSYEDSERSRQIKAEIEASNRKLSDLQSFLIFKNGGDDQFCVPLNLVVRVIKIKATDIEYTGGKRMLQYREESLPLFSIDQLASVPPLKYQEDLLVIIFNLNGHEVGLLATKPINSVEMLLSVDDKTHQEPGIMGSIIIDKRITLLVNIYEVVKTLAPHWFSDQKALLSLKEKHTILIAEDSTFFQKQIVKSLQDEGFKTILAEDGQLAWEKLLENEGDVSLLVTDIEMPRLDGLRLTERIREDGRFDSLPIVALTTLAGKDDVLRGKKAGVNEYLVKFDRDLLLENILKLLKIKH